MTREQWEQLSRRDQLRYLHAMRFATVRAWSLTPTHVERMLNALWYDMDRLKKIRQRRKSK